MTAKIHPTAIVAENVRLGQNVEIGPFSVIEGNIEIGDETIIKSHVVIEGNVKIGKKNIIFPFAAIGQAPQDLKFKGENSSITIGDNNRIREHVTIHPGTQDGRMETVIGSGCLLMVACHVAHDCIVGNNVIMANNVTLAGHVEVGDNAVLGGLAAVHQFVRIGKSAMIGGLSGVEHDVIPYATVMGERASLAGLNLIGMKRGNIARDDIHALRNFFKKLFEEGEGGSFAERANDVAKDFDSATVKEVLNFIQSQSSRSFCQMKKD